MNEFKRPSLPGSALFEAQADGADPAEMAAAGHRIATLLVRGPRSGDDQGLVDRVLHLADEEGLGVIADLWSHAAAPETRRQQPSPPERAPLAWPVSNGPLNRR